MSLDGFVPWPDDLAHAYRTAGVWRGHPLGDYPWQWARRYGDRVALVDGAHRISYASLAVCADAYADALLDRGLVPGDTVLLQLPNSWEFVAVLLGCFRVGVVPVLMLPQHRERELVEIGRQVRPAALIMAGTYRGYDHLALGRRAAAALPGSPAVLVAAGTTADASAELRAAAPAEGADETDWGCLRDRLDLLAPDPSGIALMLLSGGTTSVPKLISRTHDDYDYNLRCCAAACGITRDTVYLAALPAGHNFPLANPGILGTLSAGGTVVLLPSPRPDAVFEAIERERVTVTSAVPAVVLRWMEQRPASRRDLSSLRYVHVGGSVLSPEVAAMIGPALGCRLQQVYGMAEGLVCYVRPDAPPAVAHTTQGSPISPFDELRVVGPDELPVPPGGIGELLTRGPYTPRGYYGAAEHNRVAFTPDGWYRTGDLVRITLDGNIVVCGRVKDIINRAGEKIAAAEIETLVQEMPQVAEVAAVAVPDPSTGERVGLFARLRPGHSLELAEVVAWLRAQGLATYKLPEELQVLDDLPHTAVGKPDKQALRELVSAAAVPSSTKE